MSSKKLYFIISALSTIMMSGATSFIHVHIKLGIELLRKQVDNFPIFPELLESGFGTPKKVEETFRNQSGTTSGPQLQHLKAMASLLS
jgi:hypothetical protein